MIRLKKTIRNLLIIAALLFLFMQFNGLYFSPVQALHASEEDLHFGPSEIVHNFDYGESRYFLTRYEEYISCQPIKKALGVFWRYGGGYGSPNDKTRPIFYQEARGEEDWWIFGVRNDASIAYLEATLDDPEGEGEPITLTCKEFYDNMFYFIREGEEHLMSVTAYDEARNIVYESKYRE
jgi:hypothetical protein